MRRGGTATHPSVVGQEALEAWGRRVGESCALPLFICLSGPLGAGKSVLARAVARGAGVDGPMPSPTFNLRFDYEGRRTEGALRVTHLDLFRLEDPEEVWELGWRELGEGREIVLVEWPERAGSLLPPDRWDVRLDFVEESPELRGVRVQSRGAAPPPEPFE